MDINNRIPLMQTHLDFHTSPDVAGIGSKFSKENFQKALKLGNLDSITVFAKCHHSMCYYPTEVGTMHPGLDFDLTGAMIDAAHEIGVRAPVYITAGWSHYDSMMHPEWRSVSKDGSYTSNECMPVEGDRDTFKPNYSWYMMCLNDGEYAQHIYEITEEICKRYKVLDGLFYDICFMEEACFCPTCKKGMKEMGLDPESEADAKKYLIIKRQSFMTKCTDILRKYHPDATIYFNSGGADPYKPEYHDYSTHFEMEDLPTSEGDYNKISLRARYFTNSGKKYIGMTGKFHLAWGEFGGFKPKEALKFEVAVMAMYGAGASIGDHMHPDGEMELETYRNIGFAYDYLKKIAPYCYGGKTVCDIGLCLSDDREANSGISNILLENQLDYGIIKDNNFSDYKLVIIPDGVVLDDAGLNALNTYIANGGKLVLMADSLVENGEFQLDFGVKYKAGAEYDCDYITLREKRDNIPDAPMLNLVPAHRTEVLAGEVYADFITPYFNRTFNRFFGHKNTPHNKDSERMPAIVKNGNVVYMAHSLAKSYARHGSVYHKRYFMYALNLVLDTPTIEVSGIGAEGRCTAINQTDNNRYCINLAYAVPVKRGEATIIEDIMPVYNIAVKMRTDKEIKRVYLPLTDEELAFDSADGEVTFTVPKLECHTSIVLEY